MKCPRCEKEMGVVFETNAGCQKLDLTPTGAVESWGENKIQEGRELLCGNCFEEIGWIENDRVMLYEEEPVIEADNPHLLHGEELDRAVAARKKG